MSSGEVDPGKPEEVYLTCLAAARLGILGRERLEACLRFLDSLPPGSAIASDVLRAGFLTPEEWSRARASVESGDFSGERARGEAARAAGRESRPPEGRAVREAALPDLGSEFEILGVAGHGAMGTVYRARDVRLDRVVALKVLRPEVADDPSRVERFEKEARAAARIDHPGIVRIHGTGSADGRRYISMEFVDGVSLGSLIPAVGMAPRRALEVARDVARALQAAHCAGIIHRDVKPGNILVERGPAGDPGGGRARLVDFGIAQLDDGGTRLTRSGDLLGTPVYLSPEQALGMPTDARSDVFSLGATLHHMLLGRPPREAAPGPLSFQKAAHEEPPPIGKLKPELSRDVATICSKALRRDPRDRYGAAGAMADDIERFLRGQAIVARPATGLERGMRWAARHRLAVGVAGAVLLFLAGGALVAERLESLARGKQLLDNAGHSLRLGNPISAVDGARRVLEDSSSSSSGLRPAARDALIVALEELGFREAACALHEGRPDALELVARDVPGEPYPLAEKLWRDHLLDLLQPYLQVVMASAPASLDAFRAGRRLADLELALGHAARALERLRSLEASPHATERDVAAIRAAAHAVALVGQPGSPQGLGEAGAYALGNVLPSAPGLAFPADPQVVLVRAVTEGGETRLVFRLFRIAGEDDRSPREFTLPAECLAPDLDVQIVAVGDIDPPGSHRAGNEIVVYSVASEPEPLAGRLECFRLESGKMVRVGPPLRALGGHRAGARSLGLLVKDVTGDGAPDIVLGLASGSSLGRRMVVIEHPFSIDPRLATKVHSLPPIDAPETARNDTTSVFAGDLDGDRTLEVGCSTSCWRGYDLRAYRYEERAGAFSLVASSGKLGSIGAALPFDIDGDGKSEIIAAMTSYEAVNAAVFPAERGHRGSPEGVYAYRLEEPGAGREFRELWRDELGDTIAGRSDILQCENISAARLSSPGGGSRGEPAILVSWSRIKAGRKVSFADLYVPGSGGLSGAPESFPSTPFQRRRIYWSKDFHLAAGHWIVLGNRPQLLALLRGGSSPGWSLVSWNRLPGLAGADGIEGRRFDPLESALRAYVDLGRYSAVLDEIRRRGKEGLRGLAPGARLLLARGAGRARSWREVEDVIRAGPGPEDPGGAGSEWALWSRAAAAGIALRSGPGLVERFDASPPAFDWRAEAPLERDGRGALVCVPSPGRKDASGPIKALALEVRVREPSDFLLSLDLELERWGYDEQIQIGLLREGTREFHGIQLDYPGSTDTGFPYADILWGQATGLVNPPGFRLEAGKCYRLELEHSRVEGRVRLKVARLDADGSPTDDEVYLAWPPDAQSGQASGGAPACPPADHELGIFGNVFNDRSALTPARPALLRLRRIEVRGVEVQSKASAP